MLFESMAMRLLWEYTLTDCTTVHVSVCKSSPVTQQVMLISWLFGTKVILLKRLLQLRHGHQMFIRVRATPGDAPTILVPDESPCLEALATRDQGIIAFLKV